MLAARGILCLPLRCVNAIERAVILAEGKKITPEHLAIRLQRTDEIQLREGAGLKEIGAMAQARAEKSTILRILKQVRGNKRKCAQILKIDYTTLFDKIKKYGIEEELNEQYALSRDDN
jgi:DNA-binding NtrC family response regulator